MASEGEYIDMRNIVNEQQTDGGVYVGSTQQGAQMVTGVSGKGIKQEKPVPMPKPTKTRTTGSGPSITLFTPQQPVIGAGDLQKRKSTLRKSPVTPNYLLDCYGGGLSKSATKYYMRLGTLDAVDCHMTVARDSGTNQPDGVYADLTNDEVTYVNVP